MIKHISAFIAVYAIFTLVAFSMPVKAGTDWACKQGSTTLEKYLEKVDSKDVRHWIKIEGIGNFQNVFILSEDGFAYVSVFVGGCGFAAKRTAPEAIMGVFNLELKKIFPIVKKGSF